MKKKGRPKSAPSGAKKSDKHKSSFRTFVARSRLREPLISLFLEDMKRTPPGDLSSWRDVRSYLHEIGAPQESYIGARLAWREYVRARDT